MNTSYLLERSLTLVRCPIVPLSAAIVVALTVSSSAFPSGMTGAVALPTASATTITGSIVDDYQPPNNGGPGRTGGSGTRWR